MACVADGRRLMAAADSGWLGGRQCFRSLYVRARRWLDRARHQRRQKRTFNSHATTDRKHERRQKKTLFLWLVSSVTFPFICSNRIEFYFSISFRSVMRTRYGNGNGATELQCGQGLRKLIRMNENIMLETRHYLSSTDMACCHLVRRAFIVAGPSVCNRDVKSID